MQRLAEAWSGALSRSFAALPGLVYPKGAEGAAVACGAVAIAITMRKRVASFVLTEKSSCASLMRRLQKARL